MEALVRRRFVHSGIRAGSFRNVRGLGAAALTLLLALLLVPGTALGDFSDRDNISAAELPDGEPQGAVAETGDAYVAYQHLRDGESDPPSRLLLRSFDAAGTLAPGRSVLAPSGETPLESDLAADGVGNTVAIGVFLDGDASLASVRARYRAADGTLGPLQTLHAAPWSQGEPAPFAEPELEATPSGQFLAVWEHTLEEPTATRVLASVMPPGGPFQPRALVSHRRAEPGSSEAALTDSGAAVVTWFQPPGQTLFALRIDSNGVHGTPKSIATADVEQSRVAVDATGAALITYLVDGEIRARTLSAANQVSQATDIATGALGHQTSLNEDGDGAIAWSRAASIGGAAVAATQVKVAAVSDLATIGLTKTVSPAREIAPTPGFSADPGVGADSGGAVTISFLRGSPDGLVNQVMARPLSSAGDLGPLEWLTGQARSAGNLELAVSDSGYGLATWVFGTEGPVDDPSARIQAATALPPSD